MLLRRAALLVAAVTACGNNPGVPDAGVPDAGDPFSCDAYCTRIMAACTGANQQYSESLRCLNACKVFPLGTAADTSGNTLGCRINHAAAAQNDAGTECVSAGPGGAGVCGSNCDGFCQLVVMYCAGPNQVYPSVANCEGVCSSFGTSAKYSVTDTTIQVRSQVACLLYHVQEATTDPMNHCLADLVPEGAGRTLTCSQP